MGHRNSAERITASTLPHSTAQGPESQRRTRVVSFDIAVTTLERATNQVLAWSSDRIGRYVCAANVHMVMEAHDSPEFRGIVSTADLVLPDGMPTVWAQRLLGHPEAARVPGPQLTERLLESAAASDTPVALYGGSASSLGAFVEKARHRWPALRIAAAIAPPFRPLAENEDAEHTRRLVESGARIVFVGIGCPKQERWMAEHVGRIPAVLLGVGQAFDILSGSKRDAPRWMQEAGLGWLFRLIQEPRRLWRRYALHNPRFVGLLSAQWLRARRLLLPPQA
jgi:N-acetylglucosaminyldiphosphoundecaprenol N-acetyl-beta-D-mannosaminyltransferase